LDTDEFIGYVGLALFPLIAFIVGRYLFVLRGPVVTISSEGIRDIRIASETIPWHGIKNISTWSYGRNKVMVLALDPRLESALTLTRLARFSRGPNSVLGANGLCIAPRGLKINYNTPRYHDRLRESRAP
jgi:hypothetical protein